jgi:hypothetical protein
MAGNHRVPALAHLSSSSNWTVHLNTASSNQRRELLALSSSAVLHSREVTVRTRSTPSEADQVYAQRQGPGLHSAVRTRSTPSGEDQVYRQRSHTL